MTLVGIFTSAAFAITSITLLWFVSQSMLDKKKIIVFLPFVFSGIILAMGASIGFFSSLDSTSLALLRIIWFFTVLWIAINLWRQKWH